MFNLPANLRPPFIDPVQPGLNKHSPFVFPALTPHCSPPVNPASFLHYMFSPKPHSLLDPFVPPSFLRIYLLIINNPARLHPSPTFSPLHSLPFPICFICSSLAEATSPVPAPQVQASRQSGQYSDHRLVDDRAASLRDRVAPPPVLHCRTAQRSRGDLGRRRINHTHRPAPLPFVPFVPQKWIAFFTTSAFHHLINNLLSPCLPAHLLSTLCSASLPVLRSSRTKRKGLFSALLQPCQTPSVRVSLLREWLGPGGLPGLQNRWRVALRAAVGSTPIHSRLAFHQSKFYR